MSKGPALKRLSPKPCCIQNASVVLPTQVVECGTVLIAGGKIAYAGKSRRRPRDFDELNAGGGYACPGLMDVHIHGAGQWSLDPPMEHSLRAVADLLISRGILHFVPAMMASEEMIGALPRLIESVGLARHIPGIYVEGPFVSPNKRGGIQEQYVRPVDLRYLASLQQMARGGIIMMTFAPELGGADELPAAMRNLGILPCIGHSVACCERVAQVVGKSAVNTTHLFNGMSGLDHHEPGVAAYAVNHDNAWVELNPDGTHVHPEMLRLVLRAKRHDRIVLITDAVVSAGERSGAYRYMGRDVVATDGGVYYGDGTLVGSRILLNEGVARLIRYTGLPVHEAVNMASLNPATMLGMGKRTGSLEEGKDADVVVFSRDFRRAKMVFGAPAASPVF